MCTCELCVIVLLCNVVITYCRYGNRKLSNEVATDMLRERDDLLSMDAQVDVDKKLIQSKLLRACDAHREAQTRFDVALQEQVSVTWCKLMLYYVM